MLALLRAGHSLVDHTAGVKDSKCRARRGRSFRRGQQLRPPTPLETAVQHWGFLVDRPFAEPAKAEVGERKERPARPALCFAKAHISLISNLASAAKPSVASLGVAALFQVPLRASTLNQLPSLLVMSQFLEDTIVLYVPPEPSASTRPREGPDVAGEQMMQRTHPNSEPGLVAGKLYVPPKAPVKHPTTGSSGPTILLQKTIAGGLSRHECCPLPGLGDNCQCPWPHLRQCLGLDTHREGVEWG